MKKIFVWLLLLSGLCFAEESQWQGTIIADGNYPQAFGTSTLVPLKTINSGSINYTVYYTVIGGPTTFTLTLQGSIDGGATYGTSCGSGTATTGSNSFTCSGIFSHIRLVSAHTGTNPTILVSLFGTSPASSSNATTSAATLTTTTNNGAGIVEKGVRWQVINAPAVSTQATASKAAGGVGVRHVADCVTVSAGAATAPAATVLTINLRDGATGAGTVLWTTQITAGATATNHGNVAFCGLNLIGTANTAMTLEFSALLTNENESVTLTGYDVN